MSRPTASPYAAGLNPTPAQRNAPGHSRARRNEGCRQLPAAEPNRDTLHTAHPAPLVSLVDRTFVRDLESLRADDEHAHADQRGSRVQPSNTDRLTIKLSHLFRRSERDVRLVLRSPYPQVRVHKAAEPDPCVRPSPVSLFDGRESSRSVRVPEAASLSGCRPDCSGSDIASMTCGRSSGA